jgi:hypothetical protein
MWTFNTWADSVKLTCALPKSFVSKVPEMKQHLNREHCAQEKSQRPYKIKHGVLCCVGGGVKHSKFIATPLSHISTRVLMQKSSCIYC